MSALLLAAGVTAHVWTILFLIMIVGGIVGDDGPVVERAAKLAFPGLFVCIYFWARVGGLG